MEITANLEVETYWINTDNALHYENSSCQPSVPAVHMLPILPLHSVLVWPHLDYMCSLRLLSTRGTWPYWTESPAKAHQDDYGTGATATN